MKIALAFLLALSFLTPVTASAASLQPIGAVFFDGDIYLAQNETDKDYVRTAQFIKSDESADNWSKVIAIRHHPRLMNPLMAADKFGKKLQEDHPGLVYQVSPCNGGEEAVIEFTLDSGEAPATFNIYRFMKREGYAGLISYQFSRRVPTVSVTKVGLSDSDKQEWVDKLVKASFDYRIGAPVYRAMASRP